ncbi:DUF3375 domain-containing protein [Arthrobacter psychrochitiniphilus]|uniref:DUF3375 domain-containing protein n=1 Tax=Arthrobacter psychrochitiniphilus TaxID=291045 RepID=A0A2V3DUZ3_9MICC|nr:DUF3375 domain-containing protein [Arthrobacter psychrochitiniphilus]NYG15487.1 hypothetical protein [Arthrobacter psychrochitiniphilus]PXA67002.1 DUF3375 domain-containing protein [Arthrobacter psychrochitiniphilus]
MRSTDNAVAQWHAQKQLRTGPAWKLLQGAPWALAFLRAEFSATRQRVPLEEFHASLTDFMKELREESLSLNEAWQASHYADSWVRSQFLARPMVDGKFQYEPTAATARVLAFIDTLGARHTNLNSSRLSTLLNSIETLSQQSDPNPESRIAALEAEILERRHEINALQNGASPAVLSNDSAVAATRSVLDLAASLPADFKRMRDGVEVMLHTIRTEIMESSVTKGVAVGQVLAGDKALRGTAEGETFKGFTEFLNNPVQQARFRQSVNEVLERDFTAALTSEERHNLASLVREMRRQAAEVHTIYGRLSESLHAYVQSAEFQESVLLRKAIHAAEQGVATASLGSRTPVVTPLLFSPTFETLAGLGIFNPEDHVPPPKLAAPPALSDADIHRTPATPAPDMPKLLAAVEQAKELRNGAATLSEAYACLPDELHHINTIRGLILAARGSNHNLDPGRSETLSFTQIDGTTRTATVPLFTFTKD